MSSLNEIKLIGHVGSDPEIRAVGNSHVATLSIATNRKWTNASGELQEETQWHRCSAWNGKYGAQLADLIEKYVRKGDRIYVSGQMEYRKWTDKEGTERTSAEIRVSDIILLANRPADAPAAIARPMGVRTTPAGERMRAPASTAPAGDFESFPGALQDEPDELPF